VAASARIQSQQAAAAAAQASAQAQAASAQAQAAANAASAAAAAAAAKTVAQGVAQGAGTGVIHPAISIPAATVADNPVVAQTVASIPAATVAANGGTTLSTQIISNPVVSSTQLSVVPGSGQIISPLTSGSVATFSSVSVAFPSNLVTDSILTGAQNGTGTEKPQNPKTTEVGNSDIKGENIHTTTGLSKGAYIGIGVGFGLLALLILLAAIWFRWYHKRELKKKENDEISTADPTAAKKESAASETTAEHNGLDMNHPGELDTSHYTSLSSFRSPVSPFSAMLGSNNTSPTGNPNIHELLGSAPVEMVGSPASPAGGVEMQGSPTAEEVPGSPASYELTVPAPNPESKQPISDMTTEIAPLSEQSVAEERSGDEDKKLRPFSFVKSPTIDQFLSPTRISHGENGPQG
jgi:hypothetical protein